MASAFYLPVLPTARELLAPLATFVDEGWQVEAIPDVSTDEHGADDVTSQSSSSAKPEDRDEPKRFLSFNQLKGPWTSRKHYLKTHYDLIRENGLRAFRAAIQAFASDQELTEANAPRTMGIYDDVMVKGLTFSTRGLATKVSFSMGRVQKKINWMQSQRLTSGSLVALIPKTHGVYDTKSLKLAIVAARPLQGLELARPELSLTWCDSSQLEIDSQKSWIMLEDRSTLFEADRHTLSGLKLLLKQESMLWEYICNVKTQPKIPAYVKEQPAFSMTPIFPISNVSTGPVKTNILSSWEKTAHPTMDLTQMSALKMMLTRELSLVQGPPGTGKTYTSLQALKVLTLNMQSIHAPIVIASHTNHAVDQILRHLADIDPGSFVRLGSRSRDAVVLPHTVYNLREHTKPKPSRRKRQANKQMDIITADIEQALSSISAAAPPLRLETLVDKGILSVKQSDSIIANVTMWMMDIDATDTEIDYLTTWVGRSVGPPQPRPAHIFTDFDAENMELEALLEEEAEKRLTEDEEMNTLYGKFMALEDSLCGAYPDAQLTVRGSGGARTFMTAEDLLRHVVDLGLVERRARGILYDFFVARMKEVVLVSMAPLLQRYQDACEQRQIGRWEEDATILLQHKVIGMTTTGLCKYRRLLEMVQPKVILIEEAAECLEAHVVAGVLLPTVQSLILVGDHKQLQPHCAVRELERAPYHLNISLFERLLDCGIGHVTLSTQRRMIPAVRQLLRPFYKDLLKDHAHVLDKANRPLVQGMGKRSVWFYQHNFHETQDALMSFKNSDEAAMLVHFLRYLLWNGTSPQEVTILTFYNGQRREIARQMRDMSLLGSPSGVKIRTVDSYQGEENGIILLSLVRSNDAGIIGFSGVKNRVCVALSRAQRGLYVFGNLPMFSARSKLWNDVLGEVVSSGSSSRAIGHQIPLWCSVHRERTWMTTPEDWLSNYGGCKTPCGGTSACGHACPKLCHPTGHEEVCPSCSNTNGSQETRNDGSRRTMDHEAFPQLDPQPRASTVAAERMDGINASRLAYQRLARSRVDSRRVTTDDMEDDRRVNEISLLDINS